MASSDELGIRRLWERRNPIHYLLFYEKIPDHTQRAPPLQSAHWEHVLAAARQGELVLAGSLDDPPDGDAILLFESNSPACAEAFAATDPYVTSGIVCRWRVRAWHTVVGKDAAKPITGADSNS